MTNIIEQLQPGWNEIARQKDFPVCDPVKARNLSMKQRYRRRWVETGAIPIEEARRMRDAGLVVMAQKRDGDYGKRVRDERGRLLPQGPLLPDMVLLIKRAEG